MEPVTNIPTYRCGARCLPAPGGLVTALLDHLSWEPRTVALGRCASAARSSRARLGDGIVRLATAGVFGTGS